MDRKKKIIILGIAIVLLIVILIIIFSSSPSGTKYPKEPLEVNSLGKSSLSLDINQMEGFSNEDTKLFLIKKENHSSLVESCISSMNMPLKKQSVIQEGITIWSDGKSQFEYSSLLDRISFVLPSGFIFDVGDNPIESFFYKYFDIDFDFIISNTEKNTTGGLTYYGTRVIKGIPLEIGYGYEYSDFLKFDKNGKLVGGQLLLSNFDESDFYLPLIPEKYLKRVSNLAVYPKESYIDTSILASTLDINYLDDAWGYIEKSASNCVGNKQELIYLFKDSNQKFLLPTFKVKANCDVQYKKETYSVPSLFYLNAVDPEYVVSN